MTTSTIEDPAALAARLQESAVPFLACLLNCSRDDAWHRPVTFQTFTDAKPKPDPDPLVNVYHGALTDLGETLERLNQKGAGIFVNVNQTDLQGRCKENVTHIRGHHADLDAKKAKGSFDIPAVLAALPLEPTMAVQTPGGLHPYWLTDTPMECGGKTRWEAHEAELKTIQRALKAHGADPNACGVQTVLRVPGFDHRKAEPRMVTPLKVDGPRYTRDQIRAAFGMDEASNQAQEEAPDKPVDRKPLPGIDPAKAAARAVDYLKTAPIAVEGQGGDSGTLLVANQLKDMGCSQDQTLALMSEHWNPRCAPPWEEVELAVKVGNAYRYGREPQGISAPESIFEPVPVPEDGGECLHPFELMNKKFAFILANGSRPILHETQDEQGKPYTDFLSVQTFHEWHANVPFQSGDKIRSVSKWWMEWHGRRQYSRVGFIPEGDAPPGVFNLWRGFAVEARPGEWSKMRSHIKDVVCGGDSTVDAYVLGWLALMFQKPGTRAGTALVLRGDKGTGKGTLGDWILRIFGRHGIHVSHARHLTGNFNAHLREAAFLFCDEAFFAGDKANESVLKALVTERELIIEAKGVDAIAQRNCLHVLMASNADWVVPATANERRYCVIDVSDARMGDFEYFNALEKERDGGGLEAMLHDLLAQDLSEFNVWDIPRTQGLADQKLASLKGAERWLADAIAEESVYGYPWGSAELCVSQDEVYSAYEARARGKYHEWEPQTSKVFWKKLRRVAPTIRDTRPTEGGERIRKVVFPPLGTAREALSNFLGEGARAPEMDIFS